MSSFLTKTKSRSSYEERISTEPINTQRCRLYAIKNFEQFVAATYEKSIDDVIEELLLIKKLDIKFDKVLQQKIEEEKINTKNNIDITRSHD